MTSGPSFVSGDVLMATGEGVHDSGYLWIASAYAVHHGRVLLGLHRRFRRWVPPGGHIEAGETFGAAAAREFLEETGIGCRVLSAAPVIHPPDGNATVDAAPFYVDVLRDGFRKPAITLYFYVEPVAMPVTLDSFQRSELDGVKLFSAAELAHIDTFEQVRSLAAYAIRNHPNGAP